MSVSEKVLDAIELLATSSIEKAKYDKTIQAQILSCQDATIGKYRCRYQDAIFYAYSNSADVSYPARSYVYILVPGNDMSEQKTILGTTKKLGINYISAAQGKQAYNIVGSNGVTSNKVYYLDTDIKTYSYLIYDSEKDENAVDIDTESLERYLKQSSSLIAGATFKTDILSDRQYNGHYGITFYLEFVDNINSEETVIRSYTIDQDNMVDNPYRLVYPTEQYQIFDIDGTNFVKLKAIQIFCQDFPGATGEEQEHTLLDIGNIQISDLELFGANRLTEEQLNGVAITFFTPQGNFFTEEDKEDAAASYRDIIAQVRVKGKLVSNSQKLPFYWGRQNVGILSTDNQYNKYLGRGWQCLNDNNVVSAATLTSEPVIQWIPASDTYRVKYSDAIAKNNRFKVAVVYDGNVITREINIQNFASSVQISIVSDSGVKFYHDIGHPTLTCEVKENGKIIDPELSNYEFSWAKEDSYGNLTQLQTIQTNNDEYNNAVNNLENIKNDIFNGVAFQNASAEQIEEYTNIINKFNYIARVQKNVLHDVQIREITKFANFKCSVYKTNNDNSKIHLGTASITLINSLQTEDLYSLVINNGTVGFKYNENGIAPNNKSLDAPQLIESLSFSVYDNLGNLIDSNIIRRSPDCKIRWSFPLKDTLLTDSKNNGDAAEDSTQNYAYFDNIQTLVYNIAQRYDVKKQNNEIKLNINFKGYNLTAVTNFTFTKEGQPGTNGSEYTLKIVPNTSMADPPLYPMITIVENNQGKPTNFYLNYGLGASTASEQSITPGTAYQLFNVELYQSGQKIWDSTGYNPLGQTVGAAVWNVLSNQYSKTSFDDSLFSVSGNRIIYKNDDAHKNFLKLSGAFNSISTMANIVKCSVVYKDKTYYATMPIIVAQVLTNNIRIFLKEYTGFRYVLYTSDGMMPSFDNSHPFEFICEEKINDTKQDISTIENGSFALTYSARTNGNTKSTLNGTTIYSSNNLILNSKRDTDPLNQFSARPSATYSGECVNNAIICELRRKKTSAIIGRIHIPVHFLLNKYGLSHINVWDGNSIQINSDGGYILSPQMGAGKKDTNNGFTGVLMGQVKIPGKDKSDTGLLGYYQGQRSFFLSSQNGSGIFGKVGNGQIVIDPTQTQALLYSGSFWDTKNIDSGTGLPKNYDYLTGGTGVVSGNGLLIDLTKPYIKYGNGKFQVDNNGYLTAQGGGSIAGWQIGTTTLSSKNGTITLNSDSSVITFKNSSGKMYSGSHNSLKSAAAGFYISDDGLSIGSKFKVTSDGTLEIGNGATTSSSKHWVINGDSARSYISYGDSSYDKYFIAANINTTNKNQVYIGTDGISLGRRFSVGANGNLIAKMGQIANWTINTNSITCDKARDVASVNPTYEYVTVADVGEYGGQTYEYIQKDIDNVGVYLGTGGIRIGRGFQVTSSGSLFCNSATIRGTIHADSGYFNNGKFLNGTFNNGTFNNITVRNNSTLKDVIINGALDLNGGRAKWEPISVLTAVDTKKLYIMFPGPTGELTYDDQGNITGVKVINYRTNKDFVVALKRTYKDLIVLTQVKKTYDQDDYDDGQSYVQPI